MAVIAASIAADDERDAGLIDRHLVYRDPGVGDAPDAAGAADEADGDGGDVSEETAAAAADIAATH